MDVADTFGFLLGAWRVSRSIEDRQAGLTGSFEGSALLVIPPEWQERGVWARYDETGTLQFGGHSGPASRTLGYMRRFDGTVAVFFPDGRPSSTSTCGPGPASGITRAARTRTTSRSPSARWTSSRSTGRSRARTRTTGPSRPSAANLPTRRA